MTPTAEAIVNSYLDAFYAGRLDVAGPVLAADFAFAGPFVQVRGREAFLASAAPLSRAVRGHSLVRQWSQGGEVCSIFDLRLQTPSASGTVRLCEWHSVSGDRIVEGRALFDSAPMRALLKGP